MEAPEKTISISQTNVTQQYDDMVADVKPWETFKITQQEYEKELQDLVKQKSAHLSSKNDKEMYRLMANDGINMFRIYFQGMAFLIEKDDAIENIKRFIQGMVIRSLKIKYDKSLHENPELPSDMIMCIYDGWFNLRYHRSIEGVEVRAGSSSNEESLAAGIADYESQLKDPEYKGNEERIRELYNNCKLSLKISKDVKELVKTMLSKDFLEDIHNRMLNAVKQRSAKLEKIQDLSYELNQAQVKAKLIEGEKLAKKSKNK